MKYKLLTLTFSIKIQNNVLISCTPSYLYLIIEVKGCGTCNANIFLKPLFRYRFFIEKFKKVFYFLIDIYSENYYFSNLKLNVNLFFKY